MQCKTCFACNVRQPLDSFYCHPRMADGHVNKCKTCAKAAMKKRYHACANGVGSYYKMREGRPDRREKRREYSAKRRMRCPEKYAARMAVGNAVRDGRLVKTPCVFCGQPKVQAHHHDYSKPLDVTWCCFKCHREKFHGQVVTAA